MTPAQRTRKRRQERALRRLRHRLFFMKDSRLVEAMESYFDRRTTASKREFFA